MALALVASSPWGATAAAQALELRWDAPPECGSAADVESELARVLGAPLEQLPNGAIAAQANVVRSAGRYRMRLELSTPTRSAQRQLHAARCDELVEAAAWLIALTLDPTLPARPEHEAASDNLGSAASQAPAASTRGAAPAEGSTSTADVESRAASQQAPAARERERDVRPPTPAQARARVPVQLTLHGGARVGVFAGGGARVQAALSAFLGLGADWSYTQLSLASFLPRGIELPAPASAESWSWALALSQCVHWGDRLRGGPCAVLTGLRTSAETRGVSGAPPNQHVLWAAAGPGFTLFWRVWRSLALSAAGHVGIPISPRPRFSLEPLGPVISAEPWILDAQLGVSFAYP